MAEVSFKVISPTPPTIHPGQYWNLKFKLNEHTKSTYDGLLWKKTSKRDDLTGRLPYSKTTSQDDITGRKHYRKTTSQEDKLTGTQRQFQHWIILTQKIWNFDHVKALDFYWKTICLFNDLPLQEPSCAMVCGVLDHTRDQKVYRILLLARDPAR